uniref:AH domain-containing protein n=1 Tax=Setaria digitata TaxID=48799 RepID=A0A915Q069_9BILA
MAYARHYESSTSGLNFDRFVDRFDEPALNKMRQQYWTAKQLIRKKLGKKEDEHLLASDAEFDTKIALFRFVQETSQQILCCIDDYQHYLNELVQSEFELSKMLKEDGEIETSAAGRVMVAVARVMALSAHHRLQMRNPLLRLFGELHVFAERAIMDCADTVEAAEKARIEYRGSLLWMKKTSKELDPDAENILEKFRTAQSVVRRNKEKLDSLKLDTLQKVDLLVASRYNLFSQLLESYQKLLYNYYEQTTLAYEKIYDFVSSRKHYEFEVLTDLIEPTGELASEDGSKISTLKGGSECLIELDECEQEIEKVLQDLENLNEHDLLCNRIDSPLGLTGECENGDNKEPCEETRQTLISVDTVAAREVSNVTVPAIAPPPGWKSNRIDKVAHYTSDLMDLLSLDDTASVANSFTSDWSKLMANPATFATVTNSSSASLSPPSLALPSALLNFPAVESRKTVMKKAGTNWTLNGGKCTERITGISVSAPKFSTVTSADVRFLLEFFFLHRAGKLITKRLPS